MNHAYIEKTIPLQREREKRTGGGCRGKGQERDVPVT